MKKLANIAIAIGFILMLGVFGGVELDSISTQQTLIQSVVGIALMYFGTKYSQE